MAKDRALRIIDKENNSYYVIVTSDVNLDSAEDLLLGMHQGIVKLQGYKLAIDGFCRTPDNVEIPGNPWTFSKKFYFFEVFPGAAQEDFTEALKEMIDMARNFRIGRAEITTFEGKPLKKSPTGSMYIEASVLCHNCGIELRGKKPVSVNTEGVPTRAQMIQLEDKGAVPYRPGSKHRLCHSCAPKHLTVEEAGITVHLPPIALQEAPRSSSETTEEEVRATSRVKVKDVLEELLEFSRSSSDVDPLFLKGMMYGYLKSTKV